MYSKQRIGSEMPSSLRWALHSSVHLAANSLSGGSRGMKFPARAVVRPALFVPVTRERGTLMTPSSIRAATRLSSTISSRTGR